MKERNYYPFGSTSDQERTSEEKLSSEGPKKGPKRSTVQRILQFSKAYEVKRSGRTGAPYSYLRN